MEKDRNYDFMIAVGCALHPEMTAGGRNTAGGGRNEPIDDIEIMAIAIQFVYRVPSTRYELCQQG